MKLKIYLLVLCSSLLVSTSCSLLDENVYDFVEPEELGDSKEAADMLVMGVYNMLSIDCYGWSIHPKFLEYDSDYISGPDWAFAAYGAGNFQGEAGIDAVWNHPYTMIRRANDAIYTISNMTNVDDRHKQNCLGEMYFLKGYAYFLLIRFFGEVPVYEKSIVYENQEIQQPRRTITEVNDHIIELLTMSKDMAYKNTEQGFRAGRASAGSAAALLAKLYLYIASASMNSGQKIVVKGGQPFSSDESLSLPISQDFYSNQVKGYESYNSQEYFDKAAKMAIEVIENKHGQYNLFTNFMDAWQIANQNRQEHIFSLQAKGNDEVYGNSLGLAYTGTDNASGKLIQGLWVGGRFHWYKLFEENDIRITEGIMHKWKWATATADVGVFYPNMEDWSKKAQGYVDENGDFVEPVAPYDDGTQYASDNSHLAYSMKYYYSSDRTQDKTDGIWPILRLADVYLIAAEASNEVSGPNLIALGYLNDVRTRSNASERSIGTGGLNTKEAFRSYVIEERARELAFEGDRRWDLIRWGIYVNVMNSIGGNDERAVKKTRESKHLLYPIPSSEISSNIHINENNPGWR